MCALISQFSFSQIYEIGLYAGGSNRNAGEIHVIVRDSVNLEKLHQIEISTSTFEDLVFNDNAFGKKFIKVVKLRPKYTDGYYNLANIHIVQNLILI